MTDTRFVLDSLANDPIVIEHVLSVVIGTYEGKHQDDWNDLLGQIKEVNPFFLVIITYAQLAKGAQI